MPFSAEYLICRHIQTHRLTDSRTHGLRHCPYAEKLFWTFWTLPTSEVFFLHISTQVVWRQKRSKKSSYPKFWHNRTPFWQQRQQLDNGAAAIAAWRRRIGGGRGGSTAAAAALRERGWWWRWRQLGCIVGSGSLAVERLRQLGGTCGSAEALVAAAVVAAQQRNGGYGSLSAAAAWRRRVCGGSFAALAV